MSSDESDRDMGETESDDEMEVQSDDDDDAGVGGFLNIPLNDELRALLDDEVGDEHDEDEVFYGFAGPVPDVPVPDWQDTERIFPVHPYEREAGPTFNDAPGDGKAIDFFMLLLEERFLEQVVKWTNDNAHRKIAENPEKNKTPWKDIESTEELKAFIGMLMFIEIFWTGRMEELWNTSPDHHLLNFPGVTRVFTRTRFYQILRYLHFTAENIPRGDRNNPAYDKLYKGRPFMNHLRKRFQECNVCGKEYSLDEGMVAYKGRLGFKQYHKDKPTKWGIKVWMLTSSDTGYLFNFEVYLGKETNIRQTMPLSTRVVQSLVEPLVNSGAHVYFDRFYTSRNLLFYLEQQSIYACGTVMVNRGFPRDIVPARPRDMEQGDNMWRQDHATGIVASTWMDKKPIHTLSTIHVAEGDYTVTRHNKRGEALVVPAPPSIVDYNAKMGGVDLNDRMTGLQKARKTYHWYMRLVRKGFFWAAYNAYLLEAHFVQHKPDKGRKRDFRSFVLDLIHQLIGNFTARHHDHQSPPRPLPRLLQPQHQHFPEVGVGKDHVCVVCNEKYRRYAQANPDAAYKDCPVRRTKTIWRCSRCSVYLCVQKGFTCFSDYHKKQEYWR